MLHRIGPEPVYASLALRRRPKPRPKGEAPLTLSGYVAKVVEGDTGDDPIK